MMSLGSLWLIKNTSNLSQSIKFVKVVCTNSEACASPGRVDAAPIHNGSLCSDIFERSSDGKPVYITAHCVVTAGSR